MFLFLIGFWGGHIDNKVCTAAFQVLSDGSCVEQVYDKRHVLPLENNDQIRLPGGILGKKKSFQGNQGTNVSLLYFLHDTSAQ